MLAECTRPGRSGRRVRATRVLAVSGRAEGGGGDAGKGTDLAGEVGLVGVARAGRDLRGSDARVQQGGRRAEAEHPDLFD